MKIGVPKEIKPQESRVGMTPAIASSLIRAGHEVYVQKEAGHGSGCSDQDYTAVGCTLLPTIEAVYETAEMIVKVKEPIVQEYPLIKSHHTLFTYFHFAASETLTEAMESSGAVCIAYETVNENGKLSLLTPMSEVAGRLATQQGAKYLEKPQGGCGILLGGVPGTKPANVTVIGGGVSGTQAAYMAAGMGANVSILDTNLDRLRYLSEVMPKNVTTLYSDPSTIAQAVLQSHLVIGTVLIPGAKAPKLVTKEMIKNMIPGSVLVDVAIDQGGCFETSEPTTHQDPIIIKEGIIHYAVTNMPGAVPRTSTYALTNATSRYALQLANKGWKKACLENPMLREGLNMVEGKITYKEVAEAFNKNYIPAIDLIQ
ncbi:MAG: alanine dehydrogenase [Flavobacteriaceae bacterium]